MIWKFLAALAPVAAGALAQRPAAMLQPLVRQSPSPRPAGALALKNPPRRPEARIGHYQVLVEQVTESQYLQELLGAAPGPQLPARSGRRSAHVQLRLVADTPEAAAAVESFSVQALTVAEDDRIVEVPHYGGPLENADDAVLRAYVYAGDVGMTTREIRSLEGEITAFDQARVVRAELPAQVGAVVQVEGIRFTVAECARRDGMISVRLLGKAPAGAQLLAATLDGTYGIELLAENGEPAAPAGSTLGTTSEGEAEFNLAYQAPKGAPARLRVKALLRSGARHTLPFQIMHIPLPEHPRPGNEGSLPASNNR